MASRRHSRSIARCARRSSPEENHHGRSLGLVLRHQGAEPVLARVAPPTDKAYNVERAFRAGWGGVVWKTLGEDGPPIVNVSGPRYDAWHGPDRRMIGFNNIELITDRPFEVNLHEIQRGQDALSGPGVDRVADGDLRRGWRREAIMRASRPPVATASSSTSAVRTACWSAAWARRSARYRRCSRCGALVQGATRIPVIVKLTPNVGRYRGSGSRRAGAGPTRSR